MRRMSFALTTNQVAAETKTVTRRLGWPNLVEGDRISAVSKGMGFKKGEKAPPPLKLIEVVSNRPEQLDAITDADVVLEGFPGRDAAWFVAMFCRGMKCDPTTLVNRIEFRYVGPLPS